MKSGYDQFFKKAKENANTNSNTSINKRKYFIKRNSKKNKNKSSLIWVCLFGFISTLAVFILLEDSDEVFKTISAFQIPNIPKIEISFLKKVKAEEKVEAKIENKTADLKAGVESTETAKSDGNKKDYSEDELNHFARLAERKKELDEREKNLQKMEAEILVQKTELDAKLKDLEEMRKKISSVLDDKVQLDDKRIENLVQFYSSMKPQQSAKIMESIDESLAVEVLSRMKKKSAADIMNLIAPEKAKAISEKYAGYRK